MSHFEGVAILPTVSAKLVPIKFAGAFPDREIVSALSAQLGWSLFIEILPVKEQLKRDFYAELCPVSKRSV